MGRDGIEGLGWGCVKGVFGEMDRVVGVMEWMIGSSDGFGEGWKWDDERWGGCFAHMYDVDWIDQSVSVFSNHLRPLQTIYC